MNIRQYNKDHLKDYERVELAPFAHHAPEQENPLLFWTEHTIESENYLVDLRVFANGEYENPSHGKWAGSFSGRPSLILQLAPALQAITLGVSANTAKRRKDSLRSWWRLLDALEASAAKVGEQISRVEDVRQLTELHRQWAHDQQMEINNFGQFVRVVNYTLATLGSPQLHWFSLESPKPKRHLPPEDHIKTIRIAMKQEWEKVQKRWQHADDLRSGISAPTIKEDELLLQHYRYYENMQQKVGKSYLNAEELADGKSKNKFTRRTNLTTSTMKDGFFPNRWDIDAAFHQCLSVTGWNPCTLLSLDATLNFLRTHPKDVSKFMLTAPHENGESSDEQDSVYELAGVKARAGGHEQIIFGLWKTKFGAGSIIKTLLARTATLRTQLQQNYTVEQARYKDMLRSGALAEDLAKQYLTMHKLAAGCRSVWLYAGKNGIGWLSGRNTDTCVRLDGKNSSYLNALVHKLNIKRAERGLQPTEKLTSSDLRDAFALYVWRSTGGNILAVMRALQHRWVNTTVKYVDNNILNAEHNEKFLTFLNALFSELGQGRLDLTILAHLSRHGNVTEEMQQRLVEYRVLMKSRIHVACNDPYHPPEKIAPAFVADGKHGCPAQRCLLCKKTLSFFLSHLMVWRCG